MHSYLEAYTGKQMSAKLRRSLTPIHNDYEQRSNLQQYIYIYIVTVINLVIIAEDFSDFP